VAEVYCCYYFSFWATVSEIVHPILSDHCLSVCPICDVGILWRNGWWIKMKLGMVVGLGLSHIVLDGTQTPQRGTAPQFSAHVYCG